jgi:hypothetical protein
MHMANGVDLRSPWSAPRWVRPIRPPGRGSERWVRPIRLQWRGRQRGSRTAGSHLGTDILPGDTRGAFVFEAIQAVVELSAKLGAQFTQAPPRDPCRRTRPRSQDCPGAISRLQQAAGTRVSDHGQLIEICIFRLGTPAAQAPSSVAPGVFPPQDPRDAVLLSAPHGAPPSSAFYGPSWTRNASLAPRLVSALPSKSAPPLK